jgi:hypothetical protein
VQERGGPSGARPPHEGEQHRRHGAAAGILVGGGGAVAAVLLTFVGRTGSGRSATLLHYPGVWTVPLAFAVMVGVSLATRRRVPHTVATTMLRLHGPEALRSRP